MSSLNIWNPTLCALQLVFSRPSGTSTPIHAGCTYVGTSVIRYRLEALTEEEAAQHPLEGGNDVSESSSEYEDFLRHRRVVSAKHALHLHALTTTGGMYKDAKPLQVTNYQVNCVTSSPAGGGKAGTLKVLSVEQEDAGTAVPPTSCAKSNAAANTKQKNKGRPNRKGDIVASEEDTKNSLEGGSVDWGSKLVFFEGADTLPLHSEVELTVQFSGTIQTFDCGGIYAAKAESTGSSNADAPVLTHFEVRYARCAFPCPDDPQYRPMWQLKSIQLPDGYTTILTNGEEEGRKTLTAQRAVQRSFAPCGPLPAYVFSFGCFAEPLEQVEALLEVPEFTDDVGHRLEKDPGSLPCVAIPVRVLARRQARISVATLERILHLTLETVAALQHLFGCPLPLLQSRHVDVLLGPTMPFISGMEHHCSIILNETVFQSGRKAQGSGSAATEQAELVVHELAHHWIGNALGLPFAVKEGICQVLEQCIGDILLGKPMRKFKPDSAAAAPGPAGSAVSSAGDNAGLHRGTIQPSEKGHEFTGASYQHALNAIKRFVADRGFEAFKGSLQRIVEENVVVPTAAVEECGGVQMLRCIGGDVPPPPYLSTVAFLQWMETPP
ncbi:putative aminopeptidase [Leptomonas seymouri]|uniref:Putative aminopeptidase n=1 Tax=Leptomonas seymouri TaxID=5684 RepID=A0A0N1PC92_LEPSE|nr:putative aminopeptidase [Leptomonas seymouri]|eukprot:KPI87164.1 putative aminopeptidase [Leptomonas seymouri]